MIIKELVNNYIEIKLFSKEESQGKPGNPGSNKDSKKYILKSETEEILQIETAQVIAKDISVKIINKDEIILVHTIGMKKINNRFFILPENIIGVLNE